MTLLELMIKECVEWPEWAEYADQRAGFAGTANALVFTARVGCKVAMIELDRLADDHYLHAITREQYEEAAAKNYCEKWKESACGALEIKEPQGHPHAAIMAEYAEVAKTNPKPWEEFQYDDLGEWVMMNESQAFHKQTVYRRKPRTININGFDVPIPLRGRQKIGSSYWIFVLGSEVVPFEMIYRGQEHDASYVSSGIAHTTKEAAELHAKALLSFTAK